MLKAVSNTSPFYYLYRIGAIDLLPGLFDEIWMPEFVQNELLVGRKKGINIPDLADFPWLMIVNPNSMPSEWFVLDLGVGEIAAMALALENPGHIILLDDLLARRTAQAAGLQVWGTLKVLLEAKAQGLVETIKPFITSLDASGMWISPEIKQRILTLANEW